MYLDFDKMCFVYYFILLINVNDIDLILQMFDLMMVYLVYINVMMGGSEWMKNINEKLVVVVREIGLVMVVGLIYVVLRNLCMVEMFMIV